MSQPRAAQSSSEELEYWQHKGRYGDEVVQAMARLICGQSVIAELSREQLGELGFIVECAVRGKVSRRTLEGWVARLAAEGDRRAAAEALRRRLVEKANEAELLGRREAA